MLMNLLKPAFKKEAIDRNTVLLFSDISVSLQVKEKSILFTCQLVNQDVHQQLLAY